MRDRLAAHGIDTPVLDAKLLAQHALGFDAVQLAAREHEAVPDSASAHLEALVQRRLHGEPVARIFGSKEFYGLAFGLNEATLVPRPETELLVDLGAAFLKVRREPSFADLGTGSGCIALSLLHECASSTAFGVDLSERALAQACDNAEALGLVSRVSFIEGSWFSTFSSNNQFDLVVSNPPYIESAIIDGLDPDVRLYDPMLALDGGPDGYAPYRIISAEARSYLKADGAVMVEVGVGQADEVMALFRSNGFEQVSAIADLAGIQRVVVAYCQPIE